MAVQQGRSERRGESYSAPYVEPLSDASTPLADFFSILLRACLLFHPSSLASRPSTMLRTVSPPNGEA
jgi:hypothetical protein